MRLLQYLCLLLTCNCNSPVTDNWHLLGPTEKISEFGFLNILPCAAMTSLLAMVGKVTSIPGIFSYSFGGLIVICVWFEFVILKVKALEP